MITLHDTVQGSDEWKQARLGKFTGSNAHKLLSSFGAHEYAKAIEDSFTGNYYTKRGHLLEDEALELYEKITKSTVMHTGFVTNDKYVDCLYSPDGLHDEYVIEVKCFGEKPHMAIYNGDIPMKVLSQVHFGMMICEKQAGRLVIYNPDLDAKLALKIIDVPFNQNIHNNFKRILEAARV